MPEWRIHPRLEFGLRVENKESKAVGIMKDLSVGGCFIHSSKDFSLLPLNTRVPIAFEIPGADEYEDIYIEVEGKVVHHGSAGEGMGINFVMVPFSAANVISNFVRAYL